MSPDMYAWLLSYGLWYTVLLSAFFTLLGFGFYFLSHHTTEE